MLFQKVLITRIRILHKVLWEVILTLFIETLDKRNQVVEKLLQKNAYSTKPIENLTEALAGDWIIFPPNKKFDDDFLKNLPSKIFLVCGNLSAHQQNILNIKQIRHINVMKDETFAFKNSVLTAEGVLANILEKTKKSIFEQKYLILGSGRSGKAIAKLFSDLNLDFAMSSFDENNYALSHIFTKNNFFKEEVFKNLKNFDVIVNTVPAKIIPKEYIRTIKSGALYLEIASIESIEKTEDLAFEYVLCPALPQKFASCSAGKYLFKVILQTLEKTS